MHAYGALDLSEFDVPLEEYDVESALETELTRLTKVLRLSELSKLIWVPNYSKKLSGEVVGNTVYIYDGNYSQAMSTLRHEIVDYVVCKAIAPYKEMLNSLVKLLNDRAYAEKEDAVEKLTKLLETDPKKLN